MPIDLFAEPPAPADPTKLAVNPDLVPAMTGSRHSRNGYAGSADRLPMAYRAGSLDALALPSRMGNRLHFRDGTVKEV